MMPKVTPIIHCDSMLTYASPSMRAVREAVITEATITRSFFLILVITYTYLLRNEESFKKDGI